jgi:hypothetical protein
VVAQLVGTAHEAPQRTSQGPRHDLGLAVMRSRFRGRHGTHANKPANARATKDSVGTGRVVQCGGSTGACAIRHNR